MKIISRNCRGVAAPATARELKHMTFKLKPSLVFLMETRSKKKNIDKLLHSLKFNSCVTVDPHGLARGLALLWNKQVEVEVLDSSKNFIHVSITNKADDATWECTFTYGDPVQQRRREVWDIISSLQFRRGNPWCCVGDFNEVLHTYEK